MSVLVTRRNRTEEITEVIKSSIIVKPSFARRLREGRPLGKGLGDRGYGRVSYDGGWVDFNFLVEE